MNNGNPSTYLTKPMSSPSTSLEYYESDIFERNLKHFVVVRNGNKLPKRRGKNNLGNAQKMSFFFSARAKFSILTVNI